MNDILNAIFGLDGLGFGSPDAAFGWARPLAAWAWAVVIAAAVGVALWTYRGLTGPRRTRVLLGISRALVLVLITVLLSGPRLVRERVTTQSDAVAVLLDRSASMTLPDAGAPGETRTRDEALRGALDASADAWAALAEDKLVVWHAFAGTSGVIGEGPVPADLGAPDGRRTELGAALDRALRSAAGTPLSGIVIVSDGRSVDEPSRETVRRLEREHVPVYVVPVGSGEPAADFAVVRADAPRRAFVDDEVPVRVRIESRGGAADGPDTDAVVELIDRATGAVLDSVPLNDASSDGASTREVTLRSARADPGAAGWSVRVRPGAADLVATNNSLDVDIDLVDRPLRALYLDGYPRWEQRYLKNLLVRERSIASSNLLLSSARRYLQEGDLLIDGVPTSPGEWSDYDVIILGDIRPDLLSPDQLTQIREHVAERGAGLLWIAGEGATPGAWAGTALADLLPVSMSQGRAGLPTWDEPVVLVRAEGAARLGLLELDESTRGWPARLSDPATGWSRLRWAQRIAPERVKPTAEVLAWAVPEHAAPVDAARAGAVGSPAVLTMRYGAGSVVYVATDEIWRWRYGRGEDLPEKFWLPIVRQLGRSSLGQSGADAVLDANPERALVGVPVQLRVDLLDQELVDSAPQTVRATVEREGVPPVRVRLTRSDESGSRARYAGTWAADDPGSYTVRVTEPVLSGLNLSAGVPVAWPDDELRRPETDHALLARLAEQTGGAVLGLDELSALSLPNRELVIVGEPETVTLWDRPFVLALLVLLLTAEWIGRRFIHLA
ncbi:MAG: hypothetical protein DHS20C14_19640 [Phycisphaeraceae bacterium]|nr:MAG: hypothetical protein DHS20C14_19640 [Phycisphaeraceae bacterium]